MIQVQSLSSSHFIIIFSFEILNGGEMDAQSSMFHCLSLLDFHSSNEAGYHELAQKLTALKIAQDTLFDRYTNQHLTQTLQDLSIPDILNIFPYQEAFVHLGSRQLQKFTYVKALKIEFKCPDIPGAD